MRLKPSLLRVAKQPSTMVRLVAGYPTASSGVPASGQCSAEACLGGRRAASLDPCRLIRRAVPFLIPQLHLLFVILAQTLAGWGKGGVSGRLCHAQSSCLHDMQSSSSVLGRPLILLPILTS